MALSVVHLMRREPTEGRRSAEKAVAVCNEFAMPLVLGQARVFFESSPLMPNRCQLWDLRCDVELSPPNVRVGWWAQLVNATH